MSETGDEQVQGDENAAPAENENAGDGDSSEDAADGTE